MITIQPIVFTAYNRPHCLQETLESWAKVRGIKNVIMDFHVEPGQPATEAVIDEMDEHFGKMKVTTNRAHLGPQVNPFQGINCGFTQFRDPSPDDFVILAEDDFIVSDDILEYLAWTRDEFAGDKRVIAVSSTQFEAQGSLADVLLTPSWTGWVWGTWRDRWEQLIAPAWTFGYEYGGWDWKLIRYWCGERGYLTAVPALSRSQHIGRSGSFTTVESFEAHQSRCFAPVVPPQVYRWDRAVVPARVPYHHDGT